MALTEKLDSRLLKEVGNLGLLIAFGTPTEKFAGQSEDLFAISRFDKSRLEKVIPQAWGNSILPQCKS
jgi:hypothetical protein